MPENSGMRDGDDLGIKGDVAIGVGSFSLEPPAQTEANYTIDTTSLSRIRSALGAPVLAT